MNQLTSIENLNIDEIIESLSSKNNIVKIKLHTIMLTTLVDIKQMVKENIFLHQENKHKIESLLLIMRKLDVDQPYLIYHKFLNALFIIKELLINLRLRRIDIIENYKQENNITEHQLERNIAYKIIEILDRAYRKDTLTNLKILEK
jgi:hypothetical protein